MSTYTHALLLLQSYERKVIDGVEQMEFSQFPTLTQNDMRASPSEALRVIILLKCLSAIQLILNNLVSQ